LDVKRAETVPAGKPSSNVQMWVILLSIAGIAGIPLSLAYRRAARGRAQREARERADMIRQRLEEQPRMKPRKAEIRLENRKAK